MKTQTIINIVFAVAFVGYVVSQLNPTFDTITCKKWRVVDKDGKVRISAGTFADGTASVALIDKDEKARISAVTYASGYASMTWSDKDGKTRISAATFADGTASVAWVDTDGKVRIEASTLPDGTVVLPTKDLRTFESTPKP